MQNGVSFCEHSVDKALLSRVELLMGNGKSKGFPSSWGVGFFPIISLVRPKQT